MRSTIKCLFNLSCLLSVLLVHATHAQVCTPVAPGLVSWWSGDGNALDSRSRFNGTLPNGASFTLGNSGQAFNFTAQNQYVDIPNNPALFPSTSITVEGWVNPSTYVGCNSSYRIAHTMQTQLLGWLTLINCANNRFAAELRSQTGERNVLASNSTIPAGTFTHVAFTWDGTTLSLYINGVLDNSAPTTISSLGINSDALRIGNAIDFGFVGQIDEPSVYSRSLTADEIAAIYNAGTAGKCKPTATVAPSGLIGWWAGDGNANDISASSFNAMLQNGASYAVGKVGQAFNFTARDQYVDIPNDPALFPQAGFSLETWIRPESFVGCNPTSNVMRIAHSVPIINRGWLTQITCNGNPLGPGFLRAGIFDQNSTLNIFGSIQALPAGEFTHFAFTWDGYTMRLYVNGILEASQATTNLGIGINTENVRLGNATDFGFLGQIDEPSVFNRALSAAEVQSIFNAGAGGKLKKTITSPRNGQIGLWRGEGNALDSSGFGNNGRLIGGVNFTPGHVGQAFQFSGTNQAIALPDDAFHAPYAQLSVEAWVYPTSYAGNEFLGQNVISNTDGDGFALRVRNGFVLADLRLSNGDQFPTATTSQLPLNEWSHIAFTYNGSQIVLYRNGTSIFSQPASGTIRNVANANLCTMIGHEPGVTCSAGPTPPEYAWKGALDEVGIYDRALSSAEILAIFDEGSGSRSVKILDHLASSEASIAEPILLAEKRISPYGEPSVPENSRWTYGSSFGSNFHPSTTTLGDVTVTFEEVTTGGVTQQIPLSGAGLPALPANPASPLIHDIATTAEFLGNVDLCFNLPAFTTAEAFATLFVLHLENGTWVNRTTTRDFATRAVCAQTTSLSPFAIAPLAPTSASGSIQGRVTTAGGFGIPYATITLTGAGLSEPRLVLTNSFGYFQIEDVAVGQTYIAEVRAKRATFSNPVRVINVKDSIFILDFVSDSP